MRARILVGLATALFLSPQLARHGHAQPLVTDGLSVYYSFDEVITNEDEDLLFEDGSENKLHGLITMGEGDNKDDGIDDIRVDTEDKKRGAGSARFDTDPTRDNTVVNPDYIAICDPINQSFHNEGCGDPVAPSDRPPYVPESGFTVATWAKVEDAGTDHALFQSWATGRGFIHTYIENGGGARFTLRGLANADSIMQYREPPNGEPIPYDEWVHFAATYQKADPFDDVPGEWAFYYNGEEVASGVADLAAAGTALEILGEWGQGAFLGLVPDMKGQLVGWMDDFYLFQRGLSAEEIKTIYDGAGNMTEFLPADFDKNGTVDFADFLFLSDQFNQPVDPPGTPPDIDGSGIVDFADFLVLSSTFNQSSNASVASVPEPAGITLLGLGGLLLGLRRRRK